MKRTLLILLPLLIGAIIWLKAQDGIIKSKYPVVTTYVSFSDTPKSKLGHLVNYPGLLILSGNDQIDTLFRWYSPPFDTTRVIMLCADTFTKKNDFSNTVLQGNGKNLILYGNKNKANWAYWYIGYEVSKLGHHLIYLRDDKETLGSNIYVFLSQQLEQKRKGF